MANNITILDSTATTQTMRTTESAGIHIPHHVVEGAVSVTGTVALDPATSVSVTVGNSVTIGSLPAIAGTVTAVVDPQRYDSFMGEPILPIGWANVDGDTVLEFNLVTQNKPLPISGTVTANLNDPTNSVISNQIGDALFGGDQLTIALNSQLNLQNNVPISGTVTANVGGALADAIETVGDVSNVSNKVAVQLYDDSGLAVGVPNNPLPISGTVTAAAPNGTLTTRFGTPTTASSVFATSAVTNASRKYLLIQNVTTQSNVITVGIGFTPTTTQGIQLTAGAGITFESSYIPTGQIYILSSVTASNFAILEA